LANGLREEGLQARFEHLAKKGTRRVLVRNWKICGRRRQFTVWRYERPESVSTLLLNCILNVRRCGIRGLHRIGDDNADPVENAKDAPVALAAVLLVFELITVHDRILGFTASLYPDRALSDHQRDGETKHEKQSTHQPSSHACDFP
jgi:hypothetical protein